MKPACRQTLPGAEPLRGGTPPARGIPPGGRIGAFDALRSLMIGLVVAMHLGMSYMPYAPPWWYVISEKTDPAFLLFVNVLDLCLIPVLFFISGYFAPGSYLKKGFARFLRDKARHILLPWAIGVAVLIPVLFLALGRSVGEVIGAMRENPFFLFDHQGHLWYLAILFLFLLAYALYVRWVPGHGTRGEVPDRKGNRPLLIGQGISVVCACLSARYLTDYDDWVDVAYLITLRPVKVVGYLCLFALGAHAWRAKWFTAEGWTPRIGPWRLGAAGSLVAYLAVRLLIVPACDLPPLKTVLLPALDAACSFAMTLYLLLAGIKLQESRPARRLAKMSPCSYGIYWIHTPPMFLYLRAVNELNVPLFFKWAGGIVFTVAASWLITRYILRKAPGLRKMF